jgi:hypothetical protein
MTDTPTPHRSAPTPEYLRLTPGQEIASEFATLLERLEEFANICDRFVKLEQPLITRVFASDDALQEGEQQSLEKEERWRQVTRSVLDPAAEPPHPDDAAVDRFADAMKAKLAQAREKGRYGWQESSAEYLSDALREHLPKGDPVDVANFAMMLHQNGQSIQPPTAAPEPAPAGSLVEVVAEVIENWIYCDHDETQVARAVIAAVAEWLEHGDRECEAVRLLRREEGR